MRLNKIVKKMLFLVCTLAIIIGSIGMKCMSAFAAGNSRSAYINIGGAQCYFDVKIQGNTITLVGNSTKPMEVDSEVTVCLVGAPATPIVINPSFGNTTGFSQTYTFDGNVSNVQAKYIVAVDEEERICTVSASVN